MKRISCISIVLIIFSCSAQKEKDPVQQRIARIENNLQPAFQVEGNPVPTYSIEERLKILHIPGMSIAVVENGKLSWAKGYGIADISENRPVTTETLFLAGSISKPLAALASLEMVEEGKISLDENINDKLKSWQIPENEFTTTEKVTLRRILNHTAGLTVHGFPGYDKGDTIPSVIDVLDGKGNTPPVRVDKVPGESYRYSGGGYTIMQLMMTDQEGKSFPEIMRERVLDPLGMDKSTYENPLPEKYHALAATGYRTDGNEVEGKWPIYPEMAAAGLWTTPSQLIKYAQAIHKIYLNDEEGVISKDIVLQMLTPGMNNHGLGPGISPDNLSWGHSGADEGFRAQIVAWRDRPNAVVIMVNSDNGVIINEVLNAIAKEYGWPGYKPNIKKAVELNEAIGNKIDGDWNFDNLGLVHIKYEDGKLLLTGEALQQPVTMLAENDSTFFDQRAGTPLTFHQIDGVYKRATAAGFLRGDKIEQ